MARTKGKVGAGIFGLAILCFLLTFIQFSCGGQRVATFSGIQLVTGTTVQSPTMFGPPQTKKISGEPAAMVAFVLVIFGLILGLASRRPGLVMACICGVVAAISLFILKLRLDEELRKQGQGLISIEYAAPYWIALSLSALGAVITGVAASEQESAGVYSVPRIAEADAPERNVEPPPAIDSASRPNQVRLVQTRTGQTVPEKMPTVAVSAAAASFCDECGAKLPPDARFCEGCGTRL